MTPWQGPHDTGRVMSHVLSVPGHTEAVQMLFNPEVVSYRELLTVLFDRMDPTTLNRWAPELPRPQPAVNTLSDRATTAGPSTGAASTTTLRSSERSPPASSRRFSPDTRTRLWWRSSRLTSESVRCAEYHTASFNVQMLHNWTSAFQVLAGWGLSSEISWEGGSRGKKRVLRSNQMLWLDQYPQAILLHLKETNIFTSSDCIIHFSFCLRGWNGIEIK